MYDKKKTIKGYMGGGYMKPMGYQTGGYIPGLSRARYLTGLDRDKRIAQEEFDKQAEKLSKEQFWRGLAGKAGSFGGSLLGAALAAPTGGMSVLAGKALGTAIGRGAGELVGGSLVDAGNIKQSSTGLYKDDFDYLRKQGRKTEDLGSLAKRSIGEGAATYAGGKFNEFLDARIAEAKIDRKVFDPSTDGAIIPEQSDFLVENGSVTDKAFNELRARESVSRDDLYETLESNPMMSYEESLRGSDRLGRLNTTIADINEAEALRNQASSRSLNSFIKEFGDIPSAQKYRDRASNFADIIQRLESELEPTTGEKKPLASLQTLLQQYPEQSSLSGDSSNLDFIEASMRRQRGYAEGGYVQGYEDGGMAIRRANNSGVLKGDYLDYVGDTNYDFSPRYDRYGNSYPNSVIEAYQKDGEIKEKLDNIYYPEFLSPDNKKAFDLFMNAKNLPADEKALREKHYEMFDEISKRLTGNIGESARQLAAYDKGIRDEGMSRQYLNKNDIKNAEDLMSKIRGSKSFQDYFKESRKNRMSKSGGIEEYGHGGLIDINPFSRRIL